ncbi:hypothetical protein FQN54_008587 [Arachnomyces sp. PD_36]|nr:hypothetical protein FQN54_008587 [Arachnomyces sp. PD_36]
MLPQPGQVLQNKRLLRIPGQPDNLLSHPPPLDEVATSGRDADLGLIRRTDAGKLEFYASPPLSPPAHRNSLFLDTPRGGSSWTRLGGMDGDDRQRKQHDSSGYPTAPGMERPHPVRQSSGSSTDRFRQQHPSILSTPTDTSVPGQGRNSHLSGYGGYGYTESPSYGTPSLQAGSLQSGALQYQADFSPAASRPSPLHQHSQQQQHHQRQQQQHDQQQHHQQAQAQQEQQQFSHYGSNMVYNIGQQAQPQSPYETLPQFQPRQSTAIDVLPNHFGVPQYYSPTEQGGTGVPAVPSHYLTQQIQPAATYAPQGSVVSSTSAPSFSATMTDYNPVEASEPPEQQQQPDLAPESSNYDDAYNQYQQALRQTFENTRCGRLVDASQSLLEISEWLLGNAVDLGLVRDEQGLHSDRINLWNEFNTCWLAVCQRQKDMTLEMIDNASHQQHPGQNILPIETLDKMGKELVRLCDKMETHGLVDYQMGVWEEEILNVLGQCLDLLEDDDDASQAGDDSKQGTPMGS